MREVDPNILNDLKKGAILTGRLSDVHIKTLKMAPFIFFDDLLEVSISYNLITSPEALVPGLGSSIRFTLGFKSSYTPDQFHNERYKALANTVHTILWPEVEIIVTDSDGKNLKNVKFD